ncbi:MAG: FkbM family methyltransferase [Pseudomonadota bacterium]
MTRPSRLGPRAVTALLSRIKTLSFSQYAEDSLLAANLHPARTGFYVDVGSYHPWRFSNTYKLYLRGWHGIAIEPNPDAAAAFRRTRPHDAFVGCGVSTEAGTQQFYRFADAKLNTFSPGQAREFEKRGDPVIGKVDVACRRLDDILGEHAPGQDIDLLSVDCEGYDLAVLQSNDWARWRPGVILTEDYDQYRAIRHRGAWSEAAEYLTGHDYAIVGQSGFSFVYADTQLLKRARESRAFDLTKWQIS